jgi:hypothetical protein
MVAKILAALKREPVRVRVYSIAALVVAYLLARGVVSPTDGEFILGVLALVLGVEAARGNVTPFAVAAPAKKQGLLKRLWVGFWGGH